MLIQSKLVQFASKLTRNLNVSTSTLIYYNLSHDNTFLACE